VGHRSRLSRPLVPRAVNPTDGAGALDGIKCPWIIDALTGRYFLAVGHCSDVSMSTHQILGAGVRLHKGEIVLGVVVTQS